jgi:hypothetical protein
MPFFSPNPGLFHSPQKCVLDNSTTVFYDGDNDNLDCSCLAQIRADPDFAGPGVIAAFLFIGWLTILVAAVPAFYSVKRAWKRSKGRHRIVNFMGEIVQFESQHRVDGRETPPPTTRPNRSRDSTGTTTSGGLDTAKTSSPSPPPVQQISAVNPDPLICIFARQFLEPLCDLQIVTGIAMLIAALAQLPKITFYHEQFAVQYWWITLNSFWVSRIDYSLNTPEMRSWRAHARRIAIWLSVTLSVATQAIVALREHTDWDSTINGKCYFGTSTGNSFGQNIFWLAGTCIYAAVLTISLLQWSRVWFDERINSQREPSIRAMRRWVQNSHSATLQYKQNNTQSGVQRKLRILIMNGRTFSYTLAWLTWWVTVQFLSIWCAGNSAPVIELITYSVFAGFLTWWILFLKIQNLTLIRGDESRWTFGQILPLILLILIIFNSLDVWATMKREIRRPKEKVDTEAAVLDEP